jgi:purine-cytosine permease-like protein
MEEKATVKKEGRIIAGAMIIGVVIGLTFMTKLETVLSPLMRLPLLVVGIALMNSGTMKPTDKKVVSKNQIILLIGVFGLLIFQVVRLIINK